jgi:hypothetical protein
MGLIKARFVGIVAFVVSFATLAADPPEVGQSTKTAPQAAPLASTAERLTNAVKVLFIGNSQTWFVCGGCTNALPILLEHMVLSTGRRCKCDVSQCRGGFSLQEHWELGKAQELIQSRKWDSVVLQELVTTPIKNREGFFQAARLFHEVIRKANARTVLYLTSGPSESDGRPDPKFQESLNAAYQDLAKELDVIFAPVGPAWQQVARANPDIRLFAENDFIHPSPTGSYLAACVFFGTLFDETPVGLPTRITIFGVPWDFDAGLGTTRARELQAIAWQCCRRAVK